MKRFGTVGLCLLLALALSVPACAAVTKDESVYVLLESDGSVQKEIVSAWLHADAGLRSVADHTDIKDIVNLKDDFEARVEGNTLYWETDAADVYYQGQSDKALPIRLEASYLLNGEPIEAEALAGCSGDVTLRFTLHNTLAQERTVGRETRSIAPLFLACLIVDLPVDSFSNVAVDNGTILSEGQNQIATLVTAPGLKDSFEGLLSDKLDDLTNQLSETLTVTAHTECFELPSVVVTAACDASLLDTANDVMDELNETRTDMDDLTEATDELADGADKLAEAGGTFNRNMSKLNKEYKTFDQGVQTAKKGASDLATGAQGLAAGLSQLDAQIGALGANFDPAKLQALSALLKSLPGLSISAEERQAFQSLPSVLEAVPGAMADGIMTNLSRLNAGGGNLTDAFTPSFEWPEETPSNDETPGGETLYVGKKTSLYETPGGNVLCTIKKGEPVTFYGVTGEWAKVSYQGKTGYLKKGLLSDKAMPSEKKAKIKVKGKMNEVDELAAGQAEGTFVTLGNALSATNARYDGTGCLVTLSDSAATGAFTDAQLQVIAKVVYGAADTTKTQLAAASKPAFDKLNTLLGSYDQLIASLGAIGDPDELLKQAAALPDAAQALKDGVAKLSAGATALASGGVSLDDGLNTLSQASAQIEDALGKFKRGTGTLKSKTAEFQDGVSTYRREGIETLTERLTELIDDVDQGIAVKDAVVAETRAYKSFTGAPDQAETSVRFIMKTPEIKAPTLETSEPEAPENPAPETVQDRVDSFLGRVAALFERK